ncbi:MAG: hypothetical protein KDC38_00480 [Planctomycetes bacterium]|nr:hypothetical protein [Planctomycetota bacterium]
MLRPFKVLFLCCVLSTFVVGPASSRADAMGISVIPFLFPPISDCGTVGFVDSFYDFDGDGELDLCKVWFADSGGAYLVGGLDPYVEGDRVHVDGRICTTCLTTCPASAILFATVKDCD